jgi:hypothetical protein
MSKPVYKLCLVKGFKEAWYQLSEAEQAALWKVNSEGIERTGAKVMGPLYDCRWSNDQYATFFIIEYPDIEAAMAETANVEKAHWFRYFDSVTILGTVRAE